MRAGRRYAGAVAVCGLPPLTEVIFRSGYRAGVVDERFRWQGSFRALPQDGTLEATEVAEMVRRLGDPEVPDA